MLFLLKSVYSYVTELTEHIRVKANPSEDEDESSEFMRIFPSFVWAVRDFTLELKIADRHITSDEYLESALKLKKGEKYRHFPMHSCTAICIQIHNTESKMLKTKLFEILKRHLPVPLP